MGRLYERQIEETDPAFSAFVLYRDMDERSLEKVAKSCGKSPALMARWSARHRWRNRVHAFDLEIDRHKTIGNMRGIEKMRTRQVKLGMDLQDVGRVELSKLLKQANALAKVNAVDHGLIIKLIDVGTKLERLNRGEPGEIIESRSDDAVDYSALSTEQLKNMRDIRDTLRNARAAPGDDESEGG